MPGPLWLVIAMTCVLAVAWAVVAPPLTNADETGHFAYVQHLAETGSAPSDRGTRTVSSEEQQLLAALGIGPAIGNANARPSFSARDRAAFAAFERGVTHAQRANGDGPNQFVQNGPLYYSAAAVAYRLTPGGQIIDRVFAVRLLGGALYVAIVVLAWLLAAELFAASWPPTLAALTVALQPKLGNAAGMVNPDIMLAAIWAAFAFVGVRTVRRGLTLRRGIVLGALAGASVLTHGRGLALIPPLLTVLALSLPIESLRNRAWRPYVRPVGLPLAILLACGAFAYLYTRAKTGGAYGGELGRAGGTDVHGATVRGFLAYIFNFYFGGFQALGPVPGAGYGWRQGYIETFFSALGSLDVAFAPHIFDYLQILCAVGLLALWTQVTWFRERLLARWREGLVLAVICLSQITLLHLVSYHHAVTSNGAGLLWSGRYLLPLITIFGLAVAYVCAHLPRRIAALAAGGVIGVGIVLQLGSLGLTLDRFYG